MGNLWKENISRDQTFRQFHGKNIVAEMVRKAFRKFRKHLENLLAAEQNCWC